MVAPRLDYVITLKPGPTSLLFQLLETIDPYDDLESDDQEVDDEEVKGIIQKSLAETLRTEILKSISAQHNRSVYDDYVIKAGTSVRKKVRKEETARAIKRIELSKNIGKAIAEWQKHIKYSGYEEAKEREDEGTRKRKLGDIEDKAEELLSFSKKLKEK